VSRSATRFGVVDPPEQFDQVLLIIDFPSGAWTPPHAPNGSFYMTVLEGEISARRAAAPGQEETVLAGSTFTAGAGEHIQVGNASGTGARVIGTALLPTGTPLMTIDQPGSSSDSDSAPADGTNIADSAPGPTIVFQSSIPVERPKGAFELVHLVLDLDPGVWTPRHMHGGQEQVIVTSGDMTLQRNGGAELFAAGESWVNAGGVVHAAGNDGGSFAQVVVAILLPAGRPLTSVV